MNELERLRQQVLDLSGENQCDACGGSGSPLSGGECMCGGSGKMSDAARHLRERVVQAEAEVERLRAFVREVATWPGLRFDAKARSLLEGGEHE